MKIAVFLVLSALMLIAGGYDFVEERYVYSIDKTMTMKGHIDFDDKGMQIDYSEPEVRHIVYDGLYLDVTDSKGVRIEHLDLNEQPMMKVYMDFIHKLYRSDYKALRENFTITSSATVVKLAPIPPVDKVVKSVEVHRDRAMQLQKIMTKMSNGDEITLHIAQ
ncbi:hypothetical protein [Sulfurimonas sp. HSL3-7]|uniref:hypothetical protein n=1 Tax=Sulfonitrofixus jiaomeiensis TaxID=3131938 RepID=UPI0031F7CBF4